MTLDQLLRAGRVSRHRPRAEAIAGRLSVADRQIRAAERIDFDADIRFGHAYTAVLACAEVIVRASGYRARGQGHHHTILTALGELVAEKKELADYFNDCRDKRNTAAYEEPDQATEADADELLDRAREFRAFAEEWIRANHANLLRRSP
jgi:hypothetical protein